MEGGEVIGKKPIALTLSFASATIRAGKVTSEGGGGVAIGMTNTPSLTVGVEGSYEAPIISGTIEPSAGSKLSLLGGTIAGISGTVPSGTTFGSHFASRVDNLPEGYECVREGDYWVVRATLTEDEAAAKAMLVNTVLEQLPEKYLVAASGMAGLGSANTIHTRRLTGRFYLCGDGVSDVADGIGLVAPRVALCAAHQANMVLRILSGQLEP